MKIEVLPDPVALAQAGAAHGARLIREAIVARGFARILVAAGDVPREFFEALTRERDIAWSEVELFQLQEYIGLATEENGSVRHGLFAQLIHVTRVGRYHLLDAKEDPDRACRDVGVALAAAEIDVAFVGLGENGRLAFNDPPADFQMEKPYLIVRLDEACRREQAAQGAFPDAADVPDRAISVSIRQLMKVNAIVVIVPGARKADAVKRCVEGSVSPLAPASMLQTHPDATLYLDRESAARLA